MVASLIHANYLVILSTAPGLIDLKGTGEVVPVVEKITPEIEAMAGGTTSETAVGGMVSKISAARLATKSGCGVFIASGFESEIIARLLCGRGPGTFFVPSGLPMDAKKRWLAYFQRPAGTILVNACAVPILREQGRSLLAIGVTGVTGGFPAGEIVHMSCLEKDVFAHRKVALSGQHISVLAAKHGDEVASLHPTS